MIGNEKAVRWGILGTAAIATKVGRAIQRATGAELSAIASREGQRAREWAERNHVATYYAHYEALLDDPLIDAVYIPLPPSMHAEWTIKAAERGKHVLCEKPLARNLAESREMAAACKQHRVCLMDGVMWMHHARAGLMKRHLVDGSMGIVRRLTSAFTFNWDVPPKENIRLIPDLAGGGLGDLGYYCVRAAWWAFEQLPLRVFASARYFNNVDMNLSALLWFPGDKMASFDCGFDTVMRNWFEIAGTKATLVCDDFVLPGSNEEARYWFHAEDAHQTHLIKHCVQEVRMIEEFSLAVREKSTPENWVRQALACMLIVDYLAQAARAERIVEVNATLGDLHV